MTIEDHVRSDDPALSQSADYSVADQAGPEWKSMPIGSSDHELEDRASRCRAHCPVVKERLITHVVVSLSSRTLRTA